jgi:hypothetical protein
MFLLDIYSSSIALSFCQNPDLRNVNGAATKGHHITNGKVLTSRMAFSLSRKRSFVNVTKS